MSKAPRSSVASPWLALIPVIFAYFTCSCSPSGSQSSPAAPLVSSSTSSSDRRRFEVVVGGKHGFIDGSGKLLINPQFDSVVAWWTGDPFAEGLVAVCLGRCRAASSAGPDGKWGFIDENGAMVINPQFDDAGMFSEGLAAVCVGNCNPTKGMPDGRWGYIDKFGKYVINPQFSQASPFKEGLAVVCVGAKSEQEQQDNQVRNPFTCYGKEGYIDKTGRFAINPQFESASNFTNGLAEIFILGKAHGEPPKTGYIDKTGKYVWEPTN